MRTVQLIAINAGGDVFRILLNFVHSRIVQTLLMNTFVRRYSYSQIPIAQIER